MDITYSIIRDAKKYHRAISPIIVASTAFFIVTGLLLCLHTISAKASTTKVGIIMLGDIDAMGFNGLSYQGLVRAEIELSVVGTVYKTTTEADLEKLAIRCVADDNDLCIGVSFLTMDAIYHTASAYPNVYFAVVDTAYGTYLPNLRSLLFAAEEAGYLAGTLAARMTQSNVIGDLGGMEIPPVVAFTEGYKNGAHCSNPDVTTIISYTNDFYNPPLGAEFAEGMIRGGADVIFAVAGPTGNGAILNATQSGVWAIGVDTDQYYTLFMTGTVEGAEYLLSSAMKRADNAVFMTIADVVAGNFTSGPVTYDLEKAGVGLAPFHDAEAYISRDIQTWLNLVSQAIIVGWIDPLDPDSPCLDLQQQFLPLAQR
jgi:basic membrane lipoprotein Med (substrate-binding protein (PBP1-ABC) superfamily)